MLRYEKINVCFSEQAEQDVSEQAEPEKDMEKEVQPYLGLSFYLSFTCISPFLKCGNCTARECCLIRQNLSSAL